MAVQGTVVHRPWAARASALILVACGALLVKLSVIDVLAAARRHEASVSFGLKGIILAPALIVLGICAAIVSFSGKDPKTAFGASRMTDPRTQKLSPLGYMVVFGLIGAGGALYLYVRSQLVSYGYDV
jgi:hypothetical protein